jgi:hypothetical protein
MFQQRDMSQVRMAQIGLDGPTFTMSQVWITISIVVDSFENIIKKNV